MFFIGCGFTSRREELGGVFGQLCAKCRLVHVSATLSRSLPLVPKIKELTASLKVKYLLYGCLSGSRTLT